MSRANPKLAGRHKLTTLRLLAQGASYQQVADQMGVTINAVSAFVGRNREAIAQQKANLDDEFASLWIARKEARLAELERIVDDMQADLDSEAYEGSVTEARRVKLAALKQAAEELGQLPTRSQVQMTVETVGYEIVGVDPKDVT